MPDFRLTDLNVPAFPQYLEPHGLLVDDRACYALFYYYLLGRKAYENSLGIGDEIVYEGKLDPQYNFIQLFKTIAMIYGVSEERMVHFWPQVDLTCVLNRLPKMPHGDKYRFNVKPEIKIIDDQDCPGHVASEADAKICGICGVHINALRPPEDEE